MDLNFVNNSFLTHFNTILTSIQYKQILYLISDLYKRFIGFNLCAYVCCRISSLPFRVHLGIMQLIQNCAPKNVALVHGRSHENMELLSSKIKNEIKVNCNVISCGETCVIETRIQLPTEEDLNLLKNGTNTCKARGPGPTPIKRNTIFTIHVAEENRIIMMNVVEVCKENFSIHQNLTFFSKYKFEDPNSKLKSEENLFMIFKEKLKDWNVRLDESSKVIVESVQMEILSDETDPSQKIISVSWQNRDEDIAFYILEVLSNLS